jgi:hypothetical protein
MDHGHRKTTRSRGILSVPKGLLRVFSRPSDKMEIRSVQIKVERLLLSRNGRWFAALADKARWVFLDLVGNVTKNGDSLFDCWIWWVEGRIHRQPCQQIVAVIDLSSLLRVG